MPDPTLLSSDPRAAGLLSADPNAGVPEEGWGSRAWRWATSPLLPQIQQAARGVSDAITTHHPGESMFGSQARGALGGMIEGAGNVLSDFTSPLGIAMSAAGPILRGIKGAGTTARATAEALGGRSAGDVLLGGPTTERQAIDTLLGTKPRQSEQGIDELIKLLDQTPQGSREVGARVPPVGSMLAEGDADAIRAAREAGRPVDPFVRGPQPSGAETDPLEARFASRPQGAMGGELLSSDPFASPLDHASQPTFAEAPPAEMAERVPKPHADPYLDAIAPSSEARVPEPHTFDLGEMPSESSAAALGTEGAAAPPPSNEIDTLRRFFRFDEAPYSASGKRRLLPEEYTRERGMADTNLGQPRDVPSVPSQFRPSAGDPETEFITRSGRYNDLPAAERRAAIAQDERFNHLLGDESGFIDPAMFQGAAEGANKLRYFSMLSSPLTQAKNVAGNVGAVLAHAAENPRSAMDVLSEFFNPQTVRDAIGEYRRPPTAPAAMGENRWGDESGVLGIPGRIMGAIDRGTKDALGRAGVDPRLAEEITFTNRPKSETGQHLADFLNRTPVAKLAVPFSKTATNILERGLERTPGVGYLAQGLSKGALQTSVPKQLLGAVALAAGAKFGQDSPLVQALLASYSLPYALGAGMNSASAKKHSTSADVLSGAVDAFRKNAPLPDDYTFNPAAYLASYVPNIVKDINPLAGIDPSSFDVKHSLTGRAIAKIPILNELLLHKKAHAPRAKSAR